MNYVTVLFLRGYGLDIRKEDITVLFLRRYGLGG